MSAYRVYFYDVKTREELREFCGADFAGCIGAGIKEIRGQAVLYQDTLFNVEIRVGRGTHTITAEDFPGRIVAVKQWWVPAPDAYDPDPKPVVAWLVLVHEKQGFTVASRHPKVNEAKRVKLGRKARELVPFDQIPDPEPPKPTKASGSPQESPEASQGSEAQEPEKDDPEPFQMAWWLPTIPYGVVDAINRMAAATGSPRYAMAAAGANYNGHYVTIRFNDYRQYWTAYYIWSGPNYIARGCSLETALKAGLREYQRGALGTTVVACVRSKEEAELAESLGYQPYSKDIEDAHTATWRTPLHDRVNEAIEWERHGLAPLVGILANAKDLEDYEAKKEAALAERRAR